MKLIKKILFLLLIGIMDIVIVMNSVYAVQISDIGETVELHSKGEVPVLLRYKGIELGTNYMFYENGGSYPAYCINHQTLKSDYIADSFTANVNGQVVNLDLWRILINGYPYKTIQELGCQTEQEAFTATQHALYGYYHNHKLEDYEGVGEAGERTLQALKKILKDAENSTRTDIDSEPILDVMVYSKLRYGYLIVGIQKNDNKVIEKKEEYNNKNLENSKNIKLPKTGS